MESVDRSNGIRKYQRFYALCRSGYAGRKGWVDVMYIGYYGMDMPYGRENTMQGQPKADAAARQEAAQKGQEPEDDWDKKLKKWDEEMRRIREENKREQKRLEEERLRKKRIRKKLQEKLVLKQHLARQDEIRQLNEKISIERAVGEDVYIEKPPLSKSLSAAEIAAICSKC